MNAWDRIFEERASLRAMALLRMLVGPIVLVHLWPFIAAMLDGRDYRSSFYLPWVEWMPEAPHELYFAMLVGCVLSSITLSLGLFTRVSSVYTWAFVGYNLFLSQTHFHHNRAFLFINLTCLMLTPCGRLLSLDARRARAAGAELEGLAPLWPMYLLRFEAVSVYAASGGSKLLNPDWWSGLVTFDRVTRFRHRLDASIAPQWFIDIITTREFHLVFGKVAVATELFIAIGLLLRPTRYAAIWIAIWFHVCIGIGLNVQIFSYLAISALVIWSTPSTADRRVALDPARPGGRLLAACIRWLDWLDRFKLDAAPAEGSAALLVERDGRVLVGAAAARTILSRCPALFLWVAPFQLPGLRILWDRALRRVFSA